MFLLLDGVGVVVDDCDDVDCDDSWDCDGDESSCGR